MPACRLCHLQIKYGLPYVRIGEEFECLPGDPTPDSCGGTGERPKEPFKWNSKILKTDREKRDDALKEAIII